MKKKLFTLNVDGANFNRGIHRGLGAKVKEDTPWLILVRYVNCLELSVKDAFSGTLADEIGVMLKKI